MEFLLKTLSFIAISIMIQFIIATVLILVGKAEKPSSDEGNLNFSELFFDYSNLLQLQFFTARDGQKLGYRYYSSDTDKVLILVHGSGYHKGIPSIATNAGSRVHLRSRPGHNPLPGIL